MIGNFKRMTVEQIVDGLTGRRLVSGRREPEHRLHPGTCSTRHRGIGETLDHITRFFLERGWTDGHPVLPPTRDRVERFLIDSGHDPWKLLGRAPSSGRDLTIWSIAVNAVMAGCPPGASTGADRHHRDPGRPVVRLRALRVTPLGPMR